MLPLLLFVLCTGALASVFNVCSGGGGTVRPCESTEVVEAIAWATFDNPYGHTPESTAADEHVSSRGKPFGGWPVLRVATTANTSIADAQKMMAAGFAEGFLTQKHVLDMHRRVSSMRRHDSRMQLRNFISQQWQRIVSNDYHSDASPYAGAFSEIVALFVSQLQGLAYGYASAALPDERLGVLDLLELNYDGDAFDIVQAVEAGVRTFRSPSSPTKSRAGRFKAASEQLVLSARARLPRNTYDLDAWVRFSRHGRCTAVIVASQVGSSVKVWAGHNTWADYLELNRIFKKYTFSLSNQYMRAAHPGGTASFSFSSYPGMITSTDDWYELSSGLLVTETTTSAVNSNVLSSLSPSNGLPAWLRMSVANAISRTALEWASVYAGYNGGTYNCMWMVLDAKLVKQERDLGALKSLMDLPAGALVVVEQSPKQVWSRDMTPVLRETGVWISANRPFSDAIRRDLGYPDAPPPAASTSAFRTTAEPAHGQISRFSEMGLQDAGSRLYAEIAFKSLGRGGERAYVAGLPSRFQEQDMDAGKHGASQIATPAAYFSHADNPRGRILKREAALIRSTVDMQRLMRLNDFGRDIQSSSKPYLAVAARFDLADINDPARAANGAIDAKVAEVEDVVSLTVYTSLGPTAQGVPPFNWRQWDGPGFCGSAGKKCAPGDVDVQSLCGAKTLVQLPCEWNSDWGIIQS